MAPLRLRYLGDEDTFELSADPRELFAKPTYNGYAEIDLAQPGALAPPPTASDPYRAQPAARY